MNRPPDPWHPYDEPKPKPGYKVALRNNATGEVRLVPYEFDWDDAGPDEYLWTDGNYACDCNRALFFYGLEPEAGDYNCGMTEFSALYAELPDGTRKPLDDRLGQQERPPSETHERSAARRNRYSRVAQENREGVCGEHLGVRRVRYWRR